MTGYPIGLMNWAHRHGVSATALAELAAVTYASAYPGAPGPVPGSDREAYVLARTRIDEAATGARLWRNNVGVLQDVRGRPVRFGLANDSKALNAELKSSDLFGWRRLTIRADMVGSVIAQTVGRECKAPGWKYRGDARERAQLNWINLVNADGGDAKFVSAP